MPQATDLTGLGMSPILSAVLGNQTVAITTAGTSQATATAITSHLSVLTTAGSQTGAILPSGALVGTPYWVFCSTATSAVVYCPVGQTMNTSSNGSLTVAQNKLAVFIQHSKNNWSSILTA